MNTIRGFKGPLYDKHRKSYKTYDCLIFYVGKMFKNVVFLW